MRPPLAPAFDDGPKRPNVVLIIADDLAWDDWWASRQRWGEDAETTSFRLARAGLRSDRASRRPACSLSRAKSTITAGLHSTDAEERISALPAGQVTFVEKLKASDTGLPPPVSGTSGTP